MSKEILKRKISYQTTPTPNVSLEKKTKTKPNKKGKILVKGENVDFDESKMVSMVKMYFFFHFG